MFSLLLKIDFFSHNVSDFSFPFLYLTVLVNNNNKLLKLMLIERHDMDPFISNDLFHHIN